MFEFLCVNVRFFCVCLFVYTGIFVTFMFFYVYRCLTFNFTASWLFSTFCYITKLLFITDSRTRAYFPKSYSSLSPHVSAAKICLHNGFAFVQVFVKYSCSDRRFLFLFFFFSFSVLHLIQVDKSGFWTTDVVLLNLLPILNLTSGTF